MRKVTHSENPKDLRNTIEVDKVHISPGSLVFSKVHVGSSLKGTFLIRNEGKSKAFIKIQSPDVKDFTVEGTQRGMEIKPGVTITKNVNVLYVSPSCLHYTIPITINNRKIDYEVIILLATRRISCVPTSLDFGIIDEGIISPHRTLLLINEGYNPTPFNVDMSKTSGHIILEPNKGTVQPQSKIELKVKVIPMYNGRLQNLLAIKCDKTIIIPITATVIIPKLEPIHPCSTKQFTLIYFSPTYFGVKSVQWLMIRNYSAVDCMFATDGEHNGECIEFEELSEQNPDMNVFKIFPLDGMMQAQETKLFTITFAPTHKPNSIKKLFYFYTIIIQKIRCRYLQDQIVGPDLYPKTPDTSYSFRASMVSLSTICSLPTRQSVQYDASFLTPAEAQAYYRSQEYTEKDKIRLHICGEAELPCVKIVPDELHLCNMRMQATEIRVLELQNASAHLPIILRYQKVPFIYLKKSVINLNALESKQIAVTIIPHQLGTISTKMVFELLYYDQPKEGPPKVIGKVSVKVVLVVESVTTYPKPKVRGGLVPSYLNGVAITKAKPQKPLRSNVTYEHTQSEQDLRKTVNTHSRNIRSAAQKAPDDYEVNPETKLLCTDLDCAKVKVDKILKSTPITSSVIPLSPCQMKKIMSVPECIRTGAIAANHNLIFPLRIQNENDFQVRLYIRPDKGNIGCIRDNRYILDANACIEVKLVYLSSSIGYYTATLDLIFNESMMLSVPLIADVVPRVLSISSTEFEFNENCTHQYVTITNNLNMLVKFYWVIDVANFNIQPLDGVVENDSTMLCVVHYYPEVEGPTECLVKFASGDCQPQIVMLSASKFNRRLEMISKELNFENVPLEKFCALFAIIKNPCNFPISFKVDRTNLKPTWVKIHPMEATVQANSQYSLMVCTVCKKCVTFQGSLQLMVVNSKQKFNLTIKGNVVYPDIHVSPSSMNFQKVISNTYANFEFTVTNHCPIVSKIQFAMEDYEEFKISESDHFWDSKANGPFILEAHEAKTFYMHFLPTETFSTWFYLPIIIDDILGPPLRNDTITQLVDYYFTSEEQTADDSQYVPMPAKLPCVRITALSLTPKIVFSKKKIVFSVGRRENKKSYNLKIKNIQNYSDTVCIKVSELKEPFSYYSEQEDTVSTDGLKRGVVFNLPPQVEKEMTIVYQPTLFGKTKIFLPVYLLSEQTNKMHTSIELVGFHEMPKISLKKKYIEFNANILGRVTNKVALDTDDKYDIYDRPLPESVRTIMDVEVLFENHNQNCKLLNLNFSGNTSIYLSEDGVKNWTSDTDYTMKIQYINNTDLSHIYKGKLEISCSCGGMWTRSIIGVYENSFLTNYAFSQMYAKELMFATNKRRTKSSSLMVSKSVISQAEIQTTNFWSLFPLFPNDEDDFTVFMEGCAHAAEMWISNQVFFQEVYYSIPYCINDIYVKDVEDKKKGSQTVREAQIPYVRLLNNLIGPKVNDYLCIGEYPKNQSDQVYYVHSVFERAVELVKSHGGTFTYISAEFFLPYYFFEVYRKDLMARSAAIRPLAGWVETIEEFRLLAKQSWLDLLLQTYKVFYLSRLTIKKEEKVTYVEPLNKFFDALPKLTLRHSNVHSETEQIIIAWFQYHYDQQHSETWSKDHVPSKTISIVGECFVDGLAFVAVTMAYCPYLVSVLDTVHNHPYTIESCTHNLLTVIQCWEMVNYSFDITVEEILKPNSLRMLMLMAYLYDVLPSMYPTKTMVFKAGLSSTATKSLTLSNVNDYPVAYKPILIPANTVFKLSQNKLVIGPKKNVELKIIYHARFAKEFHCTLLLSGEVPKYHYAKNKCLSLIGIPDLTYASTVITYPANLYEVIDLQLTIQTPYEGSVRYDLRQPPKILQNYEELEKVQINTERTRFECGRIVILNDVFLSDDKGILYLNGVIRAVYANDTSTFLYFSNPESGVFLVRIDTKLSDYKKSEDVYVTLPSEFINNPELYAERHRLTISIPMQNKILWDAIKAIISRLSDDQDRAVWKNVLDMSAGKLIVTRLYYLSKYFKVSPDYDPEKPVAYRITANKACNIDLPSEVTISNEFDKGNVEIEWKLKPPHRWPHNFMMTLINDAYSKLRRYRVTFLYDKNNTD